MKKHTVVLALTLAITVGLTACVSSPHTPSDLEKRAVKKYERLQAREESRANKRRTILNSIGYAWDGFRVTNFFTKELLLNLKAVSFMARDDWNHETRRLLLLRIKEFADREVLSYFKQVRYASRINIAVAEVTVSIGDKLRALVHIGEFTQKEAYAVWGEVESWAHITMDQQEPQDIWP